MLYHLDMLGQLGMPGHQVMPDRPAMLDPAAASSLPQSLVSHLAMLVQAAALCHVPHLDQQDMSLHAPKYRPGILRCLQVTVYQEQATRRSRS